MNATAPGARGFLTGAARRGESELGKVTVTARPVVVAWRPVPAAAGGIVTRMGRDACLFWPAARSRAVAGRAIESDRPWRHVRGRARPQLHARTIASIALTPDKPLG
jgi:hypothetical protein